MSKFYKIGEFAKMIGVSQVTLREWEKRGLFKPHHKSPTGFRFYSDEQYEDYVNGKFSDERKVVLIDDDGC